MTKGPEVRSALRSGMPARSSASRMLLKLISYCKVMPKRSNSRTGVRLSSVNRGTFSARISAAMSTHGENTRSQRASSRALMA